MKNIKERISNEKKNQFGESGGCILTVLFCTLWWGPPMHQWVLEQCTVHFFFWRSSINTSLALWFDPQLGHSHERSDWLDVIIVMQNCMFFFFFSDKGNESAKGAGVQLIQHCSCGSCEFNWTGVFVLHRTTCTDYQHNCSLYSVLATRNCFFLVSKDAYNVLSLRPYNIILNIHKDICIYFGAYLISIQYLRREAECLQDLQAIQTFKKAIILSLNTAWLRGGKQYNYCLNMMDE